jgi:hypothetical protein
MIAARLPYSASSSPGGEKAIEAFQASANPVDADFLADLERIIERSRQELAALRAQ